MHAGASFLCPFHGSRVYVNSVLFLTCRWERARPLPGAVRLVKHLHSHNVPVAIASSSPAEIIKTKLSRQSGAALASCEGLLENFELNFVVVLFVYNLIFECSSNPGTVALGLLRV